MKCDELKAYGMADPAIDDEYEMYKVAEVDEAIAELKEKLHDVDNQWNEQSKEIAILKAKLAVLQSFYDLHGKVDNYIDQLKAENDQLKARLEDSWATVAFNHLDAVTRERRLQRALWLARAERAKEMCRRLLIQGFDPKWEKVERKCLKKAELYK